MRSKTYETTPGFAARVQQSLSRRLAQMALNVEEIGRGGISLDPEEVDAMTAEIRAMVRVARDLEDDGRQSGDKRLVYVHPTIPAAVGKMFEAEEASTIARRRLTDRMSKQIADPDGAIVAGIDQAIAQLEQAKTLVAGGRAVQS